jgi:hypothetical protein
MLAVLTSAFGFLAPFLPEIIKHFNAKVANADELAMLTLQGQIAKDQHAYRMEEIDMTSAARSVLRLISGAARSPHRSRPIQINGYSMTRSARNSTTPASATMTPKAAFHMSPYSALKPASIRACINARASLDWSAGTPRSAGTAPNRSARARRCAPLQQWHRRRAPRSYQASCVTSEKEERGTQAAS